MLDAVKFSPSKSGYILLGHRSCSIGETSRGRYHGLLGELLIMLMASVTMHAMTGVIECTSFTIFALSAGSQSANNQYWKKQVTFFYFCTAQGTKHHGQANQKHTEEKSIYEVDFFKHLVQ